MLCLAITTIHSIYMCVCRNNSSITVFANCCLDIIFRHLLSESKILLKPTTKLSEWGVLHHLLYEVQYKFFSICYELSCCLLHQDEIPPHMLQFHILYTAFIIKSFKYTTRDILLGFVINYDIIQISHHASASICIGHTMKSSKYAFTQFSPYTLTIIGNKIIWEFVIKR